MMSREQFEQLMNKLDTLIKVTAASSLQGKTMTDSIGFLADLGFGNSEIAGILGTTPAYVNKVKYETKKSKKKGEKKRKKKRPKMVEAETQSEQEKVENHDEQGPV